MTSPVVEYRQATLTLADKIAEAFTSPNGISQFDFILGMNGECGWDGPETVRLPFHNVQDRKRKQPALWTGLIHLLTLAADPYREIRARYDESYPHRRGQEENSEEKRPDEVRGRWWHEAVRAIGEVPGLDLVVLRVREVYGATQMVRSW